MPRCAYCLSVFDTAQQRNRHKVHFHDEQCKEDFSKEGWLRLVLDSRNKTRLKEYREELLRFVDERLER